MLNVSCAYECKLLVPFTRPLRYATVTLPYCQIRRQVREAAGAKGLFLPREQDRKLLGQFSRKDLQCPDLSLVRLRNWSSPILALGTARGGGWRAFCYEARDPPRFDPFVVQFGAQLTELQMGT